jgi:hypothetical protein
MAIKQLQYELKLPGIGFHTTKHGTLNLKYSSANILKLRDALNHAAEKLSEQALKLVEEEREEEIRRLAPPPTPAQKHEQRVTQAKGAQPRGIAKSIIERRPQPSQEGAEQSSTETAPAVPPRVIVSGGFEQDDGMLGEPPASIRR